RIGIGLELELAQLGGVVRIAEPLEHLQRCPRRRPLAIDQEHLLLGADPPRSGLEPLLLQHAIERAQIAEHGVHELAALLLVLLRPDVLVIAGILRLARLVRRLFGWVGHAYPRYRARSVLVAPDPELSASGGPRRSRATGGSFRRGSARW